MKKILALALTGAMLVSAMTGCAAAGGAASTGEAAGSAEAAAPAETSGDKVVINYYDWDGSAAGVCDAFNASQDKIEVVFTAIPDNMDKNSKLDVLAMGGGDIDVFPCGDGDQFTRMQNGMFAPLDEYVAADGLDMDASFGEMAKWCQWDGHIYGLPFRASVGAIWYNKDMFDAAGVPYPDGTWTWDEYKEIAAKLTQGEGADKIYGTYNHTWAGEFSHPATEFTPFFNEDGTSNVNAPGFVKALEDRAALDEAGVQPSYSEIQAIQAMPNSFFLGGKSAMVICGAWLIRDMKDTENYPHDFKIGFSYFPKSDPSVESDKNMFMSSTMLAVAATSKHPQEAYEFIKFMVTEGAKDIAAGGNYPCYKMAFDDEVINAFIEGSGLDYEEGAKLFDPEARIFSTKPTKAGAAAYMDELGNQESLFFVGSVSAQEAMDAVKAAMDEEIAAAGN